MLLQPREVRESQIELLHLVLARIFEYFFGVQWLVLSL